MTVSTDRSKFAISFFTLYFAQQSVQQFPYAFLHARATRKYLKETLYSHSINFHLIKTGRHFSPESYLYDRATLLTVIDAGEFMTQLVLMLSYNPYGIFYGRIIAKYFMCNLASDSNAATIGSCISRSNGYPQLSYINGPLQSNARVNLANVA